MPELPEVETVVVELANKIESKKIIDVIISDLKTIKPFKKTGFKKIILGQKINRLTRRGKNILIHLNNKLTIAIHLKMTGQLIWQSAKGPVIIGGHPQKDGHLDLPNKFTRLFFVFSDKSRLYFNDARKFGWVKILNKEQFSDFDKKLGIEPLSNQFTFTKFKSLLEKNKNKKIKPFLLDQSKIVGLGNIYVDEACFSAGLSPQRKIINIKDNEKRELFSAIKKILRQSIKNKGTSFRDYLTTDGKKGGFMPYLKVYGKTKKPCPKCQRPIKKEKMFGRGTHFCPHCQN